MATDKSGWTVGQVLADQAAARPDSPFLQFGDGAPVSYRETDAIANRVANGLAGLGVAHGGRVAVMLPNSLEYGYTWFGVSRAGAVHVAINSAYKGNFLEHVLNNSGARVMVIAREFLPLLQEIEAELPALELALVPELRPALMPGAGEGDGEGANDGGQVPAFRRVRLQPFESLLESPADPPGVTVSYMDTGAIMYTSGTTGPSKGVLMPHAHLYLFALGTVENLRLTAGDIYYICMPLFHANALLMQFYGIMMAGGKAAIAPNFSASRWLDDVRRYGATITNPTSALGWLKCPVGADRAFFQSLRSIRVE